MCSGAWVYVKTFWTENSLLLLYSSWLPCQIPCKCLSTLAPISLYHNMSFELVWVSQFGGAAQLQDYLHTCRIRSKVMMESFELDPKKNRRYGAKRILCSRCCIGCCVCLVIMLVVILGGGYAVSWFEILIYACTLFTSPVTLTMLFIVGESVHEELSGNRSQ